VSLENVLKYVNAIIAVLPLIEKVVELIERNFLNSHDNGSDTKTKKHLAMELLGSTGPDLGLNNAVVSQMVDSVVAVKNASGEFKHYVKP